MALAQHSPTTTEAFDALRRTDQLDIMVLKRAYWEHFSIEETDNPYELRVRNESWGPEADDHTHTVGVSGGIPTDCTCGQYIYTSAPCKHLVAVAMDEDALKLVG